MIRWLTLILLFAAQARPLVAATLAETRAFKSAVDMFQDKLYPQAETNFVKFVTTYPNSDKRGEALLYQAKARLFQKDFSGASTLLQDTLPQAGTLTDQYLFWLGETFFESGHFQQSADTYATLTTTTPSSPLLLEASYNQALALSKLGNWKTVIKLLNDPNGVFQKAAQTKTNEAAAIDGLILLGEALLTQKQYTDTEKVLTNLESRPLTPEAKWRQSHALCLAQIGNKQLEHALVTSSNLVATARETGQPEREATSVTLQANILEDLKRLPEAIASHEKNLADNLPTDVRRHALFKIIDLTLSEGKTPEAIARLETFTTQNTNDATLDLALFTLGELRLKQFYGGGADQSTNTVADISSSNLVTSALTNFDRVITNFPNTEFIGKAYLNRGWCYWAFEKFDFAKTNFAEAVARLAPSEDKAVACFKLGDVEFRLGNPAAALTNYNSVLRDFTSFPSVTNTLFDQALYQVVRAGLAAGNYDAAKEAMGKILEWYPLTGFAERARLLVGQELNRKGSFQEARKLFAEFIQKTPSSPLVAQVKLAAAQTYVQEKNWTGAIKQFEQWITSFGDHSLRPHAEFSRALATYHAGQETNALQLFTNLVAEFPSNALAPLAQNWIGDFYFNRQEFDRAELNYKLVADKFNPTLELACESRLAASRAAFHRQGFKEAREQLLLLINNTNTPTTFLAEAYFALGDTIYSQFLEDTNRTDDFREAISAFSRITTDYPELSIAPLAWGRIGECYLQWANISKDAAALDPATNAFTHILEMPTADTATRNHAEVGLGKVAESRGNIDDALSHYATVIYQGGDTSDPRWVKEAGLAAARICESREQWEQAIRIYRRLLAALPSLKPSIEKKMALASAQLATAKR